MEKKPRENDTPEPHKESIMEEEMLSIGKTGNGLAAQRSLVTWMRTFLVEVSVKIQLDWVYKKLVGQAGAGDSKDLFRSVPSAGVV